MYSRRFPKKITFFGIVLSKSFGPAEKTQFFPTRKIPKISLFFRRRTSKKRRKFDPLRDGSDAMIRISIRGKETCIRKDSQKKFVFLGFFEM